MRTATRWYVIGLSIVAIIWGFGVYAFGPAPVAHAWLNVLLLSLLAVAGEMLSILLPHSAAGSMAFVPYYALVLIVPSWPSVVAVAAVRALLELWARRELIKGVFNVASHAVMEAAAISVYAALGGVTLVGLPDLMHASYVTRAVGGPALMAFATGFFTNTVLVAGAVAVSSRRSFLNVWVANNRATIGADLMATPIVFIFGWVYAAFGVIFTAGLWVPILGLRQLQRVNLELQQTNEELLELMVKSLEARDPYTSGHSRRVQHYSTIIARAVGLSEREIEQVSRAALLHDVGKIHEKYASVLAKTDKLTPEEWSLIQEHPVDGANLVATMTKLRDIVSAIRHHHENWDGTGYPDGVAGELIPQAARIIRFADTIDAMTSDRPYRRPLSENDVRAELVRCRGTQFDPSITDRLVSSSLWTTIFTPSPGYAEFAHGTLSVVRSGKARLDRREPADVREA